MGNTADCPKYRTKVLTTLNFSGYQHLIENSFRVTYVIGEPKKYYKYYTVNDSVFSRIYLGLVELLICLFSPTYIVITYMRDMA